MAKFDLAAAFSGARVLVISPHADDETLGCGGTIARCVGLGAEVAVLLVSVASVRHYGKERGMVSASRREEEFTRAMAMLGVKSTDVLYRDEAVHMRLDRMPQRDLVNAIESESPISLDRFRPDVLLFPAPSYNQDHKAVFDAVYAACRPHLPADKPFVRAVLSYEQPQLGWGRERFQPGVYCDISGQLERKLDAYRCYASQVHPDPHHASVANLERLARLRGSEVSVAAAEAFACHRLLI